MPVKKNLLLLRAFSFVLTAGLLAGGVQSGEQLSQSRKAELNNLVRQDCGSCHGMTLKGGLGNPLLPQNLEPFSTSEVAEIILEGVPGTPMPPWRDLLSNTEADWIANILKKGLVK